MTLRELDLVLKAEAEKEKQRAFQDARLAYWIRSAWGAKATPDQLLGKPPVTREDMRKRAEQDESEAVHVDDGERAIDLSEMMQGVAFGLGLEALGSSDEVS